MTEKASGDAPPAKDTGRATGDKTGSREKPKEVGGRDGPDPTRFGDWEKNGRCVDF